ncbi:FtsK/SpoIIIE domain-containing protein [Knoellia koreensis]|uniref:FHA domain-containing protein n=1 Tax=Knoellia koreensis TaxID=2730921 RepID=A0A849HIZ8_9MICO|nr:FtsK/SpoIIIE domain-containing protein [Knoellia sp. DB2414S]NNM46291.1 FHA domain-containing protein [Knoellia sp. DB2414S]
MRLQLTLTLAGSGSPRTVELEVDAAPGSTARDLLTAARSMHPSVPPDAALSARGRLIEPDAVLGHPPLADGTALTLGDAPATTAPATAGTPVALAIAHGPDAGRTLHVGRGSHDVGRSPQAGVTIDDERLSRRHASIEVDADRVAVLDLGSTNGTRLDDDAVGTIPRTLAPGHRLTLGSSVLVVRPSDRVPAVVEQRPDGTVAVNRRPRRPLSFPSATLTAPSPPVPPTRGRMPWVAALVPLPVAGVLALFLGPMMLAFAVMSPVMLLGTAVTDHWSGRRRYAAELAAHEAALSGVAGAVAAAAVDEARVERARHPDAAEVLEVADGPGARIWERRRDDPDFLALSVGTCTRAGSVTVVRPDSDPGPRSSVLSQVPAVVPLRTVGPLGICGERARLTGLARLLLGQVATLHSPADLELFVLCDGPASAQEWGWVSRLPHVRTSDGRVRPAAFGVGAGSDSVARVVAALHREVQQRCSARGAAAAHHEWAGSWCVLLIDGSDDLRATPGLASILTDGPAVGVVTIALADTEGGLPLECRALLDLGRPDRAALSMPGPPVADLVVDGVGPWWADRTSRALARLRDATRGDDDWAPDGAVSLSAAVGRNLLDPSQVRDWWEVTPATTTAVIGVDAEGAASIDLAADGPHVLVGGTTGSGKSELLRTLVASLAAGNRPEHLSFVLVDYKGGAAFRACADLPHVAGVVTDLDDHLAARALTSLSAELKRRERLLAAAGVTDFAAYQRISGSAPLARLVVVIDEFRALAQELPDFVEGMVRFAALGRSLGVHVVLATQRPAGVVTADIKANVNLRIALRMRDATESLDVIDHPSAADIDASTPGRAFLSSGDGAPHAFQAATVAPAPTEDRKVLRARERLGLDRTGPWVDVGQGSESARTDTELEGLVRAIRCAASDIGARSASPAWLPPLPDAIEQDALDATGGTPIGLQDLPALQTQRPFVLDPDAGGHWAFVGSSGSGRSTALRTTAFALARTFGPDDLHVYAVSGGSLAGVAELPHCGAHVTWDDLPRLARLVTCLEEQVAERRRGLSTSGHASVSGWRGADDQAPARLVLLVDDLDLVVQRTDEVEHGRLTERLLGLFKDGAGAGLTGVLAGHRSLLVGRMAALSSTRVLLRLADPGELVLAGLSAKDLPGHQPPGRGLLADGTTVQLAKPPGVAGSGPAAGTGWRAPRRVDAIPSSVSTDQLVTDEPGLALGIGGDDSQVQVLDPERDGRRWLVTGPAGSGVSTCLTLIAHQLAPTGRQVAVVSTQALPASSLAAAGHVTVCDPASPETLVALRRRVPDLAVLVDEAHDLLDSPIEGVLREISSLLDRDGGLLVCGADAATLALRHRGLAVEVARHRTGLVLCGDSSRPVDPWGLRLPPDPSAGPGRGHVVRRGVAVPVQVAQPEAASATARPALPAPRAVA